MKRPRAILLEAVSTGEQADPTQASLPEQDFRLHEVGAARNWDIVDTILVPGFSRVFYTYREFAEAALEAGIAAPMRMFDHWAKRDFDVFAVSSGDRFGREQSIFAEVVGRTIDAGATVFTLRDGDIHKGNRRMFVSMAGYQASVEVDELVRRHRFGMAKNARRGLPTSNHGHILSHRVIGEGDNERTIVNEDARRLFMDVAEFLLAGVSWRQMPQLLSERGHYRESGRKLSASTLRKWLMHPTLWGNSAQYFNDIDHSTTARGFWVFDPTEDIPDHITIHYNTHPPMYDGEFGERIKAALRQKFGEDGNHHPPLKRKFSGLVVCDRCHYACNYKQNGGWLGVRCVSRRQVDLATECPNTRYVNEKKLIDFAKDLLRILSEKGDWSILYGDTEKDDTAERLEATQKELARVRELARRLRFEKMTTADIFQADIQADIEQLGVQAEALTFEAARLQKATEATKPSTDQVYALEEYGKLPPGVFWSMSSPEINHWLARIMGKYRFVIADGIVKGTSPQPRKYHLPTRN